MTKNSATALKNPTQSYDLFASKVGAEVSRVLAGGKLDRKAAASYLNGAASEALVELVPRDTRSTDGIFFSGKKLSKYVARCLSAKIAAGATVADPTCGAGDLLLACATLMSRGQSTAATVAQWSSRIIGLDLHGEFVNAARARLTLLAAQEGFSATEEVRATRFDNLLPGNYFDHLEKIAAADCVVMNPPFAKVQTPDDCEWAKGSVQLAGVIFASVLSNAKIGQEIVAVLPDVLRCGSRYQRWRKFIDAHCVSKRIHVYGRFDEKTDVDVFVVHLTKSARFATKSKGDWIGRALSGTNKPHSAVLNDFFKVSVGAYVPFRAKKTDEIVDYLCVGDVPADAEVAAPSKCRFNGTLHQTPFVVIRRTSNPADSRRVIPTLITGPKMVAVENHLIVLMPADGALSSCRRLIAVLQNEETDNWMNRASRCRHLTTAIVKKLPLIGWT
ncbi:N-6 DNA methylase [Massilia sp. CCM 8733]|uniref:N-6 DNA methylase n=1 Tax=Massilia mucilaginosa TaxID=2609282 RepID=A0ABX0P3F0_9BURK|nr:N-6 DNA methylase [Massilia mucilaginosa]NHZ93820.1 N-6 DNA methylase [Massilia mucilaginosa]